MIKLISALMVYAEMEMMRRKEKDSYQVQVLNATPVFEFVKECIVLP